MYSSLIAVCSPCFCLFQLALRLFSSDEALPHKRFYEVFNEAHRANDRTKSTPFLRFTWLLLWCVREPVPGCGQRFLSPVGSVVYRGVGFFSAGDDYSEGREPAWHEFSSTTMSEAVAYSFVDAALRTHSPFTIFEITLTTSRACQVWGFSEFDNEQEVLLPPGSRFLVQRVTVVGMETRVLMRELPPFEAILEYGDFIPDVYRTVAVSTTIACTYIPVIIYISFKHVFVCYDHHILVRVLLLSLCFMNIVLVMTIVVV